jgi:hypothetical protein
MQEFAGYFRKKTGMVQSRLVPAFSLILYSKPLTYYSKNLTLADTKISSFLAFLTKLKLI